MTRRIAGLAGAIALVLALTAGSASAATLTYNEAVFGTNGHVGDDHRYRIASAGWNPNLSFAKQPGGCFNAAWTKTPGIPGCYNRASPNWIQFQFQRGTYTGPNDNPEAFYSMNATGEPGCYRSWSSNAIYWPYQGHPGATFATGNRYHGCSASQYQARVGSLSLALAAGKLPSKAATARAVDGR